MKPAFSVIANGSNITSLIQDRLVSLEITDQAGVKSDKLVITMDDRDQKIALPDTGAKIEVSLGYANTALARMGSYVVDEVEVAGPLRTLTIRANAVDMSSGIKAVKERSFDGVTMLDLVKKIASDNKLTPSVSPQAAGIMLGHVDQTESDMQLLTRICAEQNCTMKVADEKLVVWRRESKTTAGDGQPGSGGKQLPTAAIAAVQCASWSATISNRGEYKSAVAYWQDTASAERKAVTVGNGEPKLTLKNSYASEDEAKRAAQSKLEVGSRAAGKVSIRDMKGDTAMSAERYAVLTGFRTGVDGSDWLITSVTHRLDSNGYTCDVDLEQKAESE